jgi:hypothetical protein
MPKGNRDRLIIGAVALLQFAFAVIVWRKLISVVSWEVSNSLEAYFCKISHRA